MNNVKQNLADYMTSLSDNNYDILEEIFLNKYRKFITLYWLLSKYSEYIDSLKYCETDKDILKIECILNKKENKVFSKLQSESDGENTVITKDGNNIFITISTEEYDPE